MVNTELIFDIFKLYKKYGVEPFSELAAFLKKSASINDLLLLIEGTQELHSKSSKTLSKKKPKSQTPKHLDSLKDSDPQKFEFLYSIYGKLLSKEMLPTLREIKFFREDNSLEPTNSKSHREAITGLINDLSKLPIEKLEKLQTNTKSVLAGLEGWSDIIMNKR